MAFRASSAFPHTGLAVSTCQLSGHNSRTDLLRLSLKCFVSVDPLCVNWCYLVRCHSCVLIDLFLRAKITQILQLFFACLLHSLPRQLLSSDVVKTLDESILLTSLCQHRILLRFQTLLNSYQSPEVSNFWVIHLDLLAPTLQRSYHPSRPFFIIFPVCGPLISIFHTNFPTAPFSNFGITHLVPLHQCSNVRSNRLILRHQFSNFSNFIDLQLIRQSFTAGEHSQR